MAVKAINNLAKLDKIISIFLVFRAYPQITKINTLLLFITVCTNLMVPVSRIHGHEIRVVSYACLDGDLLLYQSRLRGLYTDASFPPN